MTREKLINFLLTIDRQHVSDLIDIITDFGKGRAALNSTVKDVLLFAKESNRSFTRKDINLLLTEFQKYGGNTFINTIRSKDNLVSYNEILNDVFERLITNKNQSSNKEKERKIVQTLFSDNWESMSFPERYEKSTNKTNIILKNITGEAINNGRINLALKFMAKNNPAGMLASLALDASAPALRITIPFVAQIAWLKMMYKICLDRQETKSVKISSNQDLIIVDADNKDVIMTLTEYTEPPEIENKFNSTSFSKFNQLLRNIPALATKLETTKSHIVSINIDPQKLTSARDGNGLRGMVHGINKDGHPGIVENARIFEADHLKQAVD